MGRELLRLECAERLVRRGTDMAKRRRLNRRVVVILGILLTLVLLIGAAGAYRYRDRLFPKDPVLYAARGDEAYARGEYGAAVRAYKVAAGASQKPVYYFKLAKVELDWAFKAPDLKDVERRKHYEQGRAFLNHALLLDARLVEAQALRCDLTWDEANVRGNWEIFIREADKLLALDGQNHKTLWRRAMANARLAQTVKGDHAEKALADFRAALKLAPDQTDYWLGLAQFHTQASAPQQVRQTFVDALQANPSSTLLRVSFADFLRRSNFKEEARKQFEQALQHDPHNALGYLCLAGYYLGENASDEALAVLEKGKSQAGTDYRLFRDLARIHIRRGQLQQAVQELRRGLALAATTRPAEESRAAGEEAQWQMTYLLINSLLDMVQAKQGDHDALLVQAKQELDRLPDARRQAPHYAKLAGRVALTEGRNEQAVDLLEKAAAGFGQTVDQQTANLLINLYLAQNLPGKAEKIIDRILSLPGQRTNPAALLAKANLLLRYRDYATAGRYVQAVLQRHPDNVEARNLQGTLQALTGEGLPADVTPTAQGVRLLLERASLLWFNEKRDEALALTEHLNRSQPKNLAVASSLISMYLSTGDQAKLQALVAALRKEFPDNQELAFQIELINQKDPQQRLAMRLEQAERISDPYERCLAKASIFALQGKEQEYVEQLTAALTHRKGAGDVLDRLFRHGLARGNWELAQKMLNDISAADLDSCGGRLYRAELALARGQASQAAGILEEVIRDRDDLKRPRTMLGECYLVEGKLDQAEQTLREVVSDDPGYAPAIVALAQVTERMGRLDEHERWVERAYRLVPANPYIRQQHMILRAAQAGPEEVQQLIQQRERMIREEKTPKLSNRLHLAALYERAGQLDQAEQALRFVYQNTQGEQKLPAAKLLAGLLLRRNQPAQAEAVVQELLKAGGDKVGAYLLYDELLIERSAELALGMYRKAQETDPADARPSLAIARLHAAQRKWNEAVAAMKQHVELRVNDRLALKELIRYCTEAGQIDLAASKLDQVLAKRGDDVEALTLRGMLWLREGEPQRAMEVFSHLVQDHPDQALPLVWRARTHLALARLDQASADLTKARQTADRDTLLQIADLYLVMQDYPSAQEVLTGLVERQWDFAPAVARLISLYTTQQKWPALEMLLGRSRKAAPFDASLALAEGRMWMARGKPARAAGVYESLRSKGVQTESLLREHLLALIAANDLEQAATLAQVADGATEEPWRKALRAHILVRRRQNDQAEPLFQAALAQARDRQLALVVYHIHEAYGPAAAAEKIQAWIGELPHAYLALLHLGDLCIPKVIAGDQAQAEVAEKIFLRSRERAPADHKTQANRRLGVIYSTLGKHQQAEQAYLAVLAQQPDDTQALNNLAYLYTNDMEQPAKALPHAQRALTLARNDPNVLDTLGWTLARMGQMDTARKTLLRAIQAGAGMPASCYHMGWSYEKDPAGRLEQAIGYYRMGLHLVSPGRQDPLRQLLEQGVERVSQRSSLARSER